jgi:hypothetical protein
MTKQKPDGQEGYKRALFSNVPVTNLAILRFQHHDKAIKDAYLTSRLRAPRSSRRPRGTARRT